MATNADECFKRNPETSLGIAKGLVNVRNVNVFINGIRFHFIAEEGYSILTETSTSKFFSQ